MEKMDMMSMDRVQENIAKIRALFPECVTEVKRDGKVTLAVDFDKLKQEMSGMLIDEREERYQMTWPDKRKAKLLANTSISATLRPCKEESVDFDNTQNLYIEGDNLDVLKLVQETYLGKVKMIYIDPPYNTGSDFVYEDDFAQSAEEYVANSGQYDDQGNRLVENKETNGRFHTDWLNMIYPRLKLARNLLTDDGVIFISIDDNEQANLKKLCNEVFGEDNFIGQITVVGNPRGRDYGGVARMHDYLLVYGKSNETQINLINDRDGEFKLFDSLGGFELRELRNRNIKFNKENRPNLYYPFYINPTQQDENGLFEISLNKKEGWIELYPLESQGVNTVWRWGKEKSLQNLNINIAAKPMKNGSYMIVEKYRESKIMARSVWWDKDTNTEKGTLLLKDMLEGKVFDYPKTVEMLMRTIQMGTESMDENIILDFFSGSATTAHAVMQLNAEDGGHRKFICVQLPEKTDEQSEAYKAGYKNICEIGKERIRRAGKKIKENINALRPVVDEITDYEKETGQIRVARTWGNGITGRTNYAANATETFIDAKTGQRITHEYEETDPKDHYRFHPEDLDVGFRVLKLDSSNMKDVYYKAEDYAQTMIAGLEDNVKEDRTPLDLLFQVMLDLGQELSAKIEEKTIAGKTVWCVEGNNIIACFDSDINDQVVTEIAKLKPLYAVFRDSSFVSDAAAANCEQIFASISPTTSRKVI